MRDPTAPSIDRRTLLRAAVALPFGGVGASVTAAAASVPTPAANARATALPALQSAEAAVPASPSRAWTTTLPDAGRIVLTLGDPGTVFAGSDGTVTALDAETGERRWDANAGLGFTFVTSHADAAYAVADTGITAFEVSSGEKRWEFETDTGPVSALPTDDRIYVGTRGGEYTAVAADTGAREWSASFGPWTYPVGVHDDTVLANSPDGPLVAFDVATGDDRWRVDGVKGAVISGDRLFAGVDDGTLAAYDLPGKTKVWRIAADVPDGEWVLPRVVDAGLNDDVLLATGTGRIYRFDPASGEQLWATTDDRGSVAGSRIHAAAAGTVYVDNRGLVSAIDATSGAIQWGRELDASFVRMHLLDDGLYVGGDSTVWGFDAADGTLRWTFDTDGSGASQLHADDERLYAVADRTVYALDPGTWSDPSAATPTTSAPPPTNAESPTSSGATSSTPTPPTPTPTTQASEARTSADPPPDATESPTAIGSDRIPGFGALAALGSALAGALANRRRRR